MYTVRDMDLAGPLRLHTLPSTPKVPAPTNIHGSDLAQTTNHDKLRIQNRTVCSTNRISKAATKTFRVFRDIRDTEATTLSVTPMWGRVGSKEHIFPKFTNPSYPQVLVETYD